VFIAKKSAADATYDQVADDVERIARLIRHKVQGQRRSS